MVRIHVEITMHRNACLAISIIHCAMDARLSDSYYTQFHDISAWCGLAVLGANPFLRLWKRLAAFYAKPVFSLHAYDKSHLGPAVGHHEGCPPVLNIHPKTVPERQLSVMDIPPEAVAACGKHKPVNECEHLWCCLSVQEKRSQFLACLQEARHGSVVEWFALFHDPDQLQQHGQ